MNGVALFLSPQGRVGVRVYGMAMITIFLAQIIGVTVPVLGWLLFVFLNYSGICLAVKRLHDWNQSGVWVMLPYAIITTYLCALLWYYLTTLSIFGYGSPVDRRIFKFLSENVAFILFLMPLIFLSLIGLVPGTREHNRFGLRRPWLKPADEARDRAF